MYIGNTRKEIYLTRFLTLAKEPAVWDQLAVWWSHVCSSSLRKHVRMTSSLLQSLIPINQCVIFLLSSGMELLICGSVSSDKDWNYFVLYRYFCKRGVMNESKVQKRKYHKGRQKRKQNIKRKPKWRSSIKWKTNRKTAGKKEMCQASVVLFRRRSRWSL